MSPPRKTSSPKARYAQRLADGLRRGAISLPQLIELASKSPSARRWIDKFAAAADRSAPRVGLPKGATATSIAQAVGLARRTLGRRRGVVGVHFGLKTTGGQTLGSGAVICTVVEKVDLQRLGRRRAIPSVIDVGAIRFPTDVVVDRVAHKHKAVQVQDSVVTGKLKGCLSAVVSVGPSSRAYVSGHVAGRRGALIRVALPTGEVVKLGKTSCYRDDDWVDSAVIEGVAPDLLRRLMAATTDTLKVDDTDVRLPVTVRVRRDPDGVFTEIFGTRRRGNFASGPMFDLIELLDHVTRPGDSGAPVTDVYGRLIGFVIGGDGVRTLVLPASRGLFRPRNGCRCHPKEQ